MPGLYEINLKQGIWPIVVRAGQLLSLFIPLTAKRRFFFFFPYFHVGGAERVHADIVGCMPDGTSIIFFTHRSRDKKMLPQFRCAGKCFSGWILFKYLLPLSIGIISGIINRHPASVVFGCNSRFFYKMVPFLLPEIQKVDLIHAFGGGAEDFSLEVVPYINKRIVINHRTFEDFRSQYRNCGINSMFLERIVHIQNSVTVPTIYHTKKRTDRLRILYVGRGSEEKRVHIVGKAAAVCVVEGITADFILVGDVEKSVLESDRQWCSFIGEVTDFERMAELYSSADILLLTSSREGFPMVIMEAMAYGVVPVATSVGGIPEHVTDGETGVLLNQDETGLPQEIAVALGTLSNRRDDLERLSQNAYNYALNNFNRKTFCTKYRELLGC